ncbi:hypothetical protein GCM10022243_28730 [Saccharothrix violaceirubra]|uniref:Uncharacterized protein n=1 Tax=Saccharothrix violaceirubra TaxID=413306 RepID=A0A7W7T9T8_9PSEU|nr:hypothetical protein [Saccharothrix violaceirubra]MBB4969202.1 hypothetical protein [Saccharothrix violaceirubra]
MTTRAICHIPSGEMLRLQPVSHWLGRFSEFARRSATEIVLPAVGFQGPLFQSEVHSVPAAYRGTNHLTKWVRDSRESLGEGGVVWANVIIDGEFLRNELIWQRNQYGAPLAQVCIQHPVAQATFRKMISEVIALGVDGIVVDVTDAYPNSGSADYSGISAHCFCDYCMDALALKGFHEPKRAFIGDDSFIRLGLRLDDDGAAHIDPPQSWIDERDTDSLIAYALARRFVTGEPAAHQADALRMYSYLAARVAVTAEAVRSLLLPCREENIRTAVVMGTAACDWSQMVTLPAMDTAKAADEYWLPDAPDRDHSPGEWRAVQFLAGRSTYYFNLFFQRVEDVQDRMSTLGVDTFIRRLEAASKRLQANRLSSGAAFTASLLNQFEGFVGIPLGRQDRLELVGRLTREMTDVAPHHEALTRFRNTEPPH